MEMGGEILSWIIGIGLAVALLGGSSRKRRRRRHHSRGRKSSVRRFDRQHDVTDRRGGSGRFPRAALPGRVVRIIDGDGLVAEVPGFGRLNVRLAYLDAPEHDQPWGQKSKEALTRLTRGSPIQLRLLYRDRYARAVAVVLAGGVVLNEELVRHGHAWVYSRYLPAPLRSRYGALEHAARQSRVGLWGASTKPVPPWEWRRRAASGWLAWLVQLLRRIFRAD